MIIPPPPSTPLSHLLPQKSDSNASVSATPSMTNVCVLCIVQLFLQCRLCLSNTQRDGMGLIRVLTHALLV
jgi:hypothetical protein